MKIFEDPAYKILPTENDCYVFYNSTNHFACHLNKLDLNILNLIYVYRDIDTILNGINTEHHDYVYDAYKRAMETNILSKNISTINLEDTIEHATSYYLHLTYRCNLNCTYCYNKDIRTTFKDLLIEDWKKIIDQIIPFANRIVLTGGEPFLFSKITELVSYIKSKKSEIYIEIISNCMVPFEANQGLNLLFKTIDSITFSCDDLSSEEQARVNFRPNVFKENISYLRNKFSDLSITINSVLSKNNFDQVKIVRGYCQEERLRFKSVLLVPNDKNEVKILPSLDKFVDALPKTPLKLPMLRRYCGAGIGLLSIDPVGNVYPCQNLHRPSLKMGNLLRDSIADVFNSSVLDYIKDELSIDKIPTCKDCNVKYICGGGCRAATLKLESGIDKYPSTLCRYYKEMAVNSLSNLSLK